MNNQEEIKNKLPTELPDNQCNGMFCYSREALLNRMTYKRSEETLRLSERPQRNPVVRPIQTDLFGLPKRAVKGRKYGFTDENFKLI